MSELNVFRSIGSTTRRIEPFHSQFLADALCASLLGERSLFEGVWRLAAPDDWQPPAAAVVNSEHPVGDGKRIDICIVDSAARRVLGIEVKTASASARPGQLEDYAQRLVKRHQGSEIAIAYLTPFNRRRAPEEADSLPTVRAFEQFEKAFNRARHVSWLDVADLNWDRREIWLQHQAYVRGDLSSPRRLTVATVRNRAFDDFFGVEAALRFWEELAVLQVHPGEQGSVIDLAQFQGTPQSLAQALAILIEDGIGVSQSDRADHFPEALRERFERSRWGDFHAELFGLSAEFPNVWIQGERDYGVRVAHERHRSGVSLVTTSGPDNLRIGRPR